MRQVARRTARVASTLAPELRATSSSVFDERAVLPSELVALGAHGRDQLPEVGRQLRGPGRRRMLESGAAQRARPAADRAAYSTYYRACAGSNPSSPALSAKLESAISAFIPDERALGSRRAGFFPQPAALAYR